MPSTASAVTDIESVLPSQRIAVMDAVRGVALLGILLMNIEYFTRPLQGILLGLDPALAADDYVVAWGVMMLVQGKFWTLFSLLFGMGFALMRERSTERGADFAPIYWRRLWGLLLIGLIHAFLIWAGDILVSYAIAGFLLLLFFRRTPVARLWKWGFVLYLLPMLFLGLMGAAIEFAKLDPSTAPVMAQELAQGERDQREAYAAAERVYRDGNYRDVVRQRVADSLDQYRVMPLMTPMLLGVFLLGAWLLRSGVMRRPEQHLSFFRRGLWIGAPIGVALALLAMRDLTDASLAAPTLAATRGTMVMAVANLLLCLAYMSAVVLLALGPWPNLIRWLAPVGRMTLSNYLLQSLFFTTLFYGYGLGLWGQVSRSAQLVLALAFFLAQMLLSRCWLGYFRYGPVEWLWRALSYGKPPPMRL